MPLILSQPFVAEAEKTFRVQGTISALSSIFPAGSAHPSGLFLFAGVEVGKDQEFAVDTRGAGGQGKLDVTILSPSRKVVPCLVAPVAGRESSTAKFIPREEGLYAIDLTYDGHPVPGSPYMGEASLPPDPSKVSFSFLFQNVSSLGRCNSPSSVLPGENL